MVREFTLVDGSGEEYSLTNEEHLLYNPSGLGFEHENTYRQVGNRFILANSVPKQSVISGTVHFSAPNAYYDYQEFVEFCGRNGLKLEYRLAEMASRRINKKTGTVVWSQIEGGIYAGSYDFITGNYNFTECLVAVDNDTVITEETTLLESYTHYSEFPPALRIYSIGISSGRKNGSSTIYPIYCNGLPARDWDIEDLSLTFKIDDKYVSGTAAVGGSVNKIYFVVMLDALVGKTAKQWLIDNNAVFAYTLETPITGTDTAYQFNPKMMYNPEVEFIGYDKNGLENPSTGLVTYEDINGNIIEKSGNKIILEDSQVNHELNSLVVSRSINNKNLSSRFFLVDTDLVNDANRDAWNIGDNTKHASAQTYAQTVAWTYSNLPVAYLHGGNYRITGTFKVSTQATFGTYPTQQSTGAGWGYFTIKPYLRMVTVSPSTVQIAAGEYQTDDMYVGMSETKTISKGFEIPFSIDITLSECENNVLFNVYLWVNSHGTSGSSGGSHTPFVCVCTNCYFRGVSIENLHIYNTDVGQEVASVSSLSFDASSIKVDIYQADSQHYQRGIFVSKVEKTELTKFSSLECKVTMECLEPWGDPFTSFVEHGTSPDPVNSITFDTDCHALSPCDLYISGPCTNPTWTQTVNGVEVTTGGYTGTIASGEQLLIRAKDGACGIYLINGSGNIDDVYKYSDFSKDRFVFIRYGENVITVTDGTDPTTQIDCYIEGELYYESV